ncbi:uncharacterized protein [Asterias amurensis]|uniref:uncharacterized protein isoform X2 n=1 Tax=Asterias amurensis TaxID=7602 RepID=UPI003AB1986A
MVYLPRSVLFLLVLCIVCICPPCPHLVEAVLPDYTPALDGLRPMETDGSILADRIGYHFVRHLKRMLQKLGLKRRQQESSQRDIIQAITTELQGSGSCCGYRAMWQRLLRDHHLHVKRDTVRQLLLVLDPDGVMSRKKRRLRRRVYVNKGPHYLVHVDGYDKLKPYGFAIHGAIDGFSRRILWLEVGPTNNDPGVVAKYYVDYIQEIKGVPHIIRTDRGTENTLIEDIQIAFRYHDGDEHSGLKSFMYGKSTSNQRIERWWGSMRTGSMNYWLNTFKDMVDTGAYDNSCPLQKECIRFCFTRLLRSELHRTARLWNEHHIRYCKNSEGPHGKPDTMFFLPQLYGTHEYKHEVSLADIRDVNEEFCTPVSEHGCSEEFLQIVEEIMTEEGYTLPQTNEEAVLLFSQLRDIIVDM